MNDLKTFTINTVDEKTYADLARRNKISPKQLYLVDDDKSNRTVLPSYDLLKIERAVREAEDMKNAKALSGLVASLSIDYDKDARKINLTYSGGQLAEIDATDFIKDGMLSSARWLSDERVIELAFNTDGGEDVLSVNLFDIFESLETDISELKAKTDNMSAAVALSVDTMSSHIAVSVDTLRTDIDTMSSHIAVSVDMLRTDIDAMSAQVALSVDEISSITQEFIVSARLSIDNLAKTDAIQNLRLDALDLRHLVETECVKRINSDKYAATVSGNKITFTVIDPESPMLTDTGLVSWIRHIISNGAAVGTDVNSVKLAFGDVETTISSSADAENGSVAAKQLMKFLSDITGKKYTDIKMSDLLDKMISMTIAVPETSIKHEFVIQTEIQPEKIISDISSTLMSTINEISTSVALSVDAMSSHTAISVDNLRTDVDAMSACIAVSVDVLETKTDDMSAAIALSVDMISSHTAVSVDMLKQTTSSISNAIEISVVNLLSDISDIGLSVAGISSQTELSVNNLIAHINEISGDLTGLIGAESDKRAADDQYLSGRLDEHINALPGLLSGVTKTANAYTDGKLNGYVSLEYLAAHATSQITDDNKIITQNDIADFNKIMHFVGTIQTDAPDPISAADYSAFNGYKVGDVLISKSGKEYVFLSSDANEQRWYKWEVFGDQNIYVEKTAYETDQVKIAVSVDNLCAEIKDVKSDYLARTAFNDISTTIGLDAATSDNTVLTLSDLNAVGLSIDTVSSRIALSVDEISGAVILSVSEFERKTNTMSSNIAISVDQLDMALDNKVKVGDYSELLSAVDELSVVHIDQEEYYRLAKLRQLDQTVVYILSGNYFNAYDLPVKYVGTPTEDQDAVNLSTLTSKMSITEKKIEDLSEAFTKKTNDISSGVALSVYAMSSCIALSVAGLCAAVDDRFLMNEAFAGISTTIGLDAATSDNKVLTLSDLNDIELSVDNISTALALSVENLENKTDDVSCAFETKISQLADSLYDNLHEVLSGSGTELDFRALSGAVLGIYNAVAAFTGKSI